ncbi:ABC transporter permease subunit [Thermocatellispora tengchongensis]|uniref:ABC transporter permease subunit n=1 Tax=Thermocatellispora tengchongensis TaxID=1073253 RepID=UPI00363AFDA2
MGHPAGHGASRAQPRGGGPGGDDPARPVLRGRGRGLAYAEAARLAGVRGVRLALRHILPNALGPVVQVFAVMFGGLLGGAVVVETIFNYPGVGFELQQAVANRDVPMVQGLALALAALALAVLLLGDIVGTLVNPRLRSAP